MKKLTVKLLFCFGLISLFPDLSHGNVKAKIEANIIEDKNSTKIASNAAQNKDFKTIKPVRQHVRVTLDLKGYFEDPDARPFSINTQSWSEIKVVNPPTHGKHVKKGDSLIKIDLSKIQKKLLEIKHELAILNLNQEILSIELKRDEEVNKIELQELDRMEKFNQEDYSHFKEIDLPYEKKSAAYDLKKYVENLSYLVEELNQLKKMYEADDLTEETEEIILIRTQNEVNRYKFALEGAKIRKDKRLKFEIPQSESTKKDAFNKKKLTINANRIIKPAEIRKKRLEIKKIEEGKRNLLENKIKLEKDLNKLQASAPIKGSLFVGTFDSGKWSGTKLFEAKLKTGGLLKPFEEFVTICPGNRIQAKIKVPEKNLLEISKLKDGLIVSGTHSELKLKAQIKEVLKFPTSPESYDAIVNIEFPKKQPLPLPGTSCTLKIITYEKKNALTLPQASVFQEDHDTEIKYIYILNSNQKPTKKIVKTGKKSGSNIEILDGIRNNTKVLKDKPEL
tara:strand:+ start:3051 stop:4571 length:1521 start_codon:yes stop_codon:yes gene_type:complete